MSADILTRAKRIVVKVGTSVLTERGGDQLSPARVHAIAEQVAAVHRAGRQVLVVTSGAIGAGMRILGYRSRPTELSRLQAASAVGQGRLMHLYESAFAEQGCHAAQLLLTKEDLRGRRRLNAKATLKTLLGAGVIPVINENDSVSVEEIRVGDNDQLAAHVAVLADAQLLMILSDVDGFRPDPRDPTTIARVIHAITPAITRAAGGSTKATSTGGMQTKLSAARIGMAHQIRTLVVNGHDYDVLTGTLLNGEARGTLFTPFAKDGL
ncbi:MAG: glutamate 5-kinase [Omnitrophica WOR_2 bacterium RIFCSPHIGHO2_02_FULL_68_15]|nr:MAG: glutamate 5-kinase [Omnitrophica WOR_2 bacterium RIFCSPHIGHO2_02_FULL_68_15]